MISNKEMQLEFSSTYFKLDLDAIDKHLKNVFISWNIIKGQICNRCQSITMVIRTNSKHVTTYFCKQCHHGYSNLSNTIFCQSKLRLSLIHLIMEMFLQDSSVSATYSNANYHYSKISIKTIRQYYCKFRKLIH